MFEKEYAFLDSLINEVPRDCQRRDTETGQYYMSYTKESARKIQMLNDIKYLVYRLEKIIDD